MEPSERVRVEVGPSSARRLGGGRRRPVRPRRAGGADAMGTLPRHPRLAAWARGAASRLPGALVAAAALACLALGLAALLASLLGAGCDMRVVCACALAPALACCLGQVTSPRGAAAAALACLAAVAAGVVLAHAQLAQEAQGLAQAASRTGDADATALLAALSAVLVTMASFLSYACRASWVMALAAVPLLMVGPLAGRPCPPAGVALLAAYFALALPHDRVTRRGGRPAASLALVVGASLLGAAAGMALAASCMDALSAPAKSLEARATQALGQLGAWQGASSPDVGDVAGQNADTRSSQADGGRDDAADGQADKTGAPSDDGADAGATSSGAQEGPRSDVATTGRVRRDALGSQEEAAHEVTLDHEPEGAVYLRQFTGADYADGAWGANPDGQDDSDAFLDGGEADHPRLAQLAADNPRPDAAAAEAFVLQTLAEDVTYTTQMAPIPADADIPEYVLFDGHEGYCQHFATVATLLLRDFGVPARYVAGYAAPASAFTLGDDGLWHAWLDGRSAHAWAEVWDDATGTWQVLETTPAGTAAAPEVDFGAAAPEKGADSADSGEAEVATAQATDVQAASAGADVLARPDGQAPVPASAAGGSAGPDAATAAGTSGGNDAGAGTSPAAGSAAGAGEAGGAHASDGAASAGGEGASQAAGDGSQALGLVRRLLARALAVAAVACALLVLVGLALRRALLARRRRVLAARRDATASELLAQAVAALRFAGIPVDAGNDEALAPALAQAAGLAQADADHLAHEALRCAFGPDQARRAPADERCRAAYRTACEHARARLRGPRAWWFAYGRAWL